MSRPRANNILTALFEADFSLDPPPAPLKVYSTTHL